jgi:hypothetical protein
MRGQMRFVLNVNTFATHRSATFSKPYSQCNIFCKLRVEKPQRSFVINFPTTRLLWKIPSRINSTFPCVTTVLIQAWDKNIYMLFDKVTSIIKRRHGIEAGFIYQFIINGTLLPRRPPIQTLTAPDQNDIN